MVGVNLKTWHLVTHLDDPEYTELSKRYGVTGVHFAVSNSSSKTQVLPRMYKVLRMDGTTEVIHVDADL